MKSEINERASIQIKSIINDFDNLTGEHKLEFIKFILEKMENGEIMHNNKAIYPNDIGIEDGFALCRAILKLIKK